MTRITHSPDEDGSLDDMVIRGGIESVHVERMDTGHWWFAVYTEDGVGYHFNFHSKRRITGSMEPGVGASSDFLYSSATVLCRQCGEPIRSTSMGWEHVRRVGIKDPAFHVATP